MTLSRRAILRSTCASALLGLAALLAGCASQPRIGDELREGERVCEADGWRLIQAPPETARRMGVACPACPHSVLRAEVFCDSCGQPVRHELRKNAGRR